LKVPNTKRRPGRVAQVVECLFSQHEAMSSNPSTARKKNTLPGIASLVCYFIDLFACNDIVAKVIPKPFYDCLVIE
jgi:hypothetical protein